MSLCPVSRGGTNTHTHTHQDMITQYTYAQQRKAVPSLIFLPTPLFIQTLIYSFYYLHTYGTGTMLSTSG